MHNTRSPDQDQRKCTVSNFTKFSHLEAQPESTQTSKIMSCATIKYFCEALHLISSQSTIIYPVSSSSRPEVFLGKGVLNICSKLTGGHLCRSAISIRLLCNFIEIALRHKCPPVDLLHIFRTPFRRNTSRCLLLNIIIASRNSYLA